MNLGGKQNSCLAFGRNMLGKPIQENKDISFIGLDNTKNANLAKQKADFKQNKRTTNAKEKTKVDKKNILIDKKELTTETLDDGSEISTLIHCRKIGDREYVMKTITSNGGAQKLKPVSERLSKMTDKQAQDFLKEWNDKWKGRALMDSEIKAAIDEAVKKAKEAALK